jgi:ABC-type transport system involved in cytochrome c biogenesis permease subunit
MPAFLRALASLQLTVVLLVTIAVLLSFGTILESLRGTEAARAVYYAPWFFALQGLFAINVIAALWERFPRNRWRIGFLVTHASMLLILAGALMTAGQAVQGRLPLWEGQTSGQFLRERHGAREVPTSLPFQVRLDAYETDYYPGTMRPAQFRSRVTVIEPSGRERPAVIQMNQPLQHGGWAFFQSSYRLEQDREMSILSVSRDPGQNVVFWGYYLLVLGMIVVLITRIAQHREAERPKRPGGFDPPIAAPAAAIVAGLMALALASPAIAQQDSTGHDHAAHDHAAPAAPARPLTPADVQALRRLPVQHDGREMPFDTQAREAVLQVTGRRHWPGTDPVAMVLGWVMHPEAALDQPVVKVDRHVAGLAGAPPGTRHMSFRRLLDSPRLRAAVGPALSRAEAGQPQQPGDKSILELYERAGVLESFLSREGVRIVPGRHRPARWGLPPLPGSPASWPAVEAEIRRQPPAFYPTPAAIAREIRYHQVDPDRIAWWLLLPAAIAAGMTLERDRWKLRWVARFGLVAGFAVMTWGIAERWQIAGRIPASNMYESMLFLGWGVGLFGVIALAFRSHMLAFNAAGMAALVTLLLDRLPIDPFVHPMAPVLSGTPWLAIHVPIIMVSYSTFAIATFLAHVQLGVGLFAPQQPARVEKWSRLLYWYLMVGSILLIAGILTGSIWAASSWGRYWGWDPKEVWSLVAFLAYMAILHARSDGQISSFGVAVASIASFWTILMTYLGVNFVLASGLHSYGFGSNRLVTALVVVALAEAAFLGAAWWRRSQVAVAGPAHGFAAPSSRR